MDIFSYLEGQDTFREIDPPCGYKGGKRRFSAAILQQITQKHPTPRKFYDLCCGSGAVFLRALEWGLVTPDQITCVDAGFWGLFWQAVAEGTLKTDLVEDLLLRQHPKDPQAVADWLLEDVATRDPSPETFVVLQAAAWGGDAVWWHEDSQQWMQGEGLRKFKPRAYWEPGPNSPETKPRPTLFQPDQIAFRVRRIANTLKGRGLDARHGLIGDVVDVIEPGSVVYLDPPYGDTSGYGVNLDLPIEINRLRTAPLYVSEGCELPGTEGAWKLSADRKKASLNGNNSSDPTSTEEWLNFFLPLPG